MMRQPEDVSTAFQAAWNAHDMDAFGALFHPDAAFVNRFGTFARGVAAIVAMHRGIHETVYRDSTLANDLHAVDVIADGVATVHFYSRLATGPAFPAGPTTVDTLLVAVMARAGDGWLIRAVENVTLSDPMTGAMVLRG